jgi:hypothetical protein
MTMGAGSPSLTYIRGVWGGSFTPWYQVNLLGLNQGSVSNYANIYYDSDNTNYYLDPTSTTNIRYLKVNTTGSSSATRALTIKADGQVEINFGAYPGSWTSALQIQNNDNTDIVWISPLDNGQNARFRTGGSGLDFYTDGTSTDTGTYSAFIGSGSVRAPIFYDLDDTDFFVDPNNVSRLELLESVNYADFREANLATNDWNNSGLTITPTAWDYSDGAWYVAYSGSDWSRGILSKRRFRRVEGLTFEFEAYSDTGYNGQNLWMMGFVGGDSTTYSYCQTPSNLIYQTGGGLRVYENCADQSTLYSPNTYNQWVRFRIVLKSQGAEYYVFFNNTWNLIRSTTNNFTNYEFLRIHLSLYSGRLRLRNLSVYREQSYYRGIRYENNVSIRSLAVGTTPSLTQGRIDASSQIRAPIYYDSNNTSYYADLSTSGISLNFLGVARGGTASLSSPTFSFSSDSDTGMYRYTTNTIGFSTGGNDEFRIYTDHTLSPGSSRAPIFYDSNNTAYFADPNNTSNFNNLYIQGGVGGISNSSSYTEAAIEVRERGFGGAQDDTWATAPRISFHWGGRVASQIGMGSNGRIYIRNNPGTGNEAFEAASVYATIFYDSDNTGYYLDPASTTSLRTVGSWRSDSSSWDGEFAGKIQYHSSNWYFQYASQFIFRNSGGGNVFYGDTSGNTWASSSSRAPIFYDSDDTTVRWDSNYLVLRGGSPTIYFRDTDGNSAMLHNNSNLFYILRGGTDTESWSSVLGWWPAYWDLTNNNCFLGGNVYARAEITAYYSDRRLKTNIEPIQNALEKVNKLNGITYNPNELAANFGYETEQRVVGLFADEVETVLPEAVKLAPFDTNTDGTSKTGENYKTVQYEKVVPLLVEAIKEQNKTIDSLKEKIVKLEKILSKFID